MNLEKIKLFMTISLAVVLALLLVSRATKGGKRPRPVTGAVSVPLMDNLRSEIRQSLTGAVTRSLLDPAIAPRTYSSLPRDPFAFRPPVETRALQPPQNPASMPLPPLPPDDPPVEEQLRLKATAIDRYSKLAFINDQVLTEGQSILGYTIIRIAAGHIVLARDDEVIHVRLAAGGKP